MQIAKFLEGLFAFLEKQWSSSWTPELLLRPAIVLQLIGFLLFSWVGLLSGESFLSLSYPVLLQPDSQVSPGEGADPQVGSGMTASWRSNPQAGRVISTSWDPWTGGSPSRLRHDNLPRTRSLGRLRHVNHQGPKAGVAPHDHHDQCWSFIGPEPDGPELTMRE